MCGEIANHVLQATQTKQEPFTNDLLVFCVCFFMQDIMVILVA